MTWVVALWIGLGVLYALFLAWYGGRGRPLTDDERQHFMAELARHATSPDAQELLEAVRRFVAVDDGREFVMQNLARYRAKAAYPRGAGFGDDARAADRRYGRAIVPELLRRGSVPVFIAARAGRFIEPEGADAWHYVAMVRYRSKRDFLRFALAIERGGIAVHKWAALEKTHVFPLRPVVSLLAVRTTVGALLAALGLALTLLLR